MCSSSSELRLRTTVLRPAGWSQGRHGPAAAGSGRLWAALTGLWRCNPSFAIRQPSQQHHNLWRRGLWRLAACLWGEHIANCGHHCYEAIICSHLSTTYLLTCHAFLNRLQAQQASPAFGGAFGSTAPAFGASQPAFRAAAASTGGLFGSTTSSPFGSTSTGQRLYWPKTFSSQHVELDLQSSRRPLVSAFAKQDLYILSSGNPRYAGFGGGGSFGASTPAFGAAASAPAFGAPAAASAPAFGATSAFGSSFGASAAPASGGFSFSAPAFGATGGSLFGATTPASPFGGAALTSAFGATSTPAFSFAQSTPAFGAAGSTAFGAASTPGAFNAASTPAFGGGGGALSFRAEQASHVECLCHSPQMLLLDQPLCYPALNCCFSTCRAVWADRPEVWRPVCP